MTTKTLTVELDESKYDELVATAEGEGITIELLVKGLIEDYFLGPDTNRGHSDDDSFWEDDETADDDAYYDEENALEDSDV